MGEQTTIALLSLVVCHVALVLDLIALSTNEWIDTDVSEYNNETETCTKGLWKICCGPMDQDKDCEYVDQTEQEVKHKAVQGLYVSAAGTLIVAAILFWVFLLVSHMNRSIGLTSLIVSLEYGSAVIACVALLLHGLTYKNSVDIPVDLIDRLGWSYWIAVVGGAFTLLAALFGTRQLMLMRARPVGYIDL